MVQNVPMMRALSIAITVSLAVFRAFSAEGDGSSGAAPSIRFDRTTHDFGTIPSDAKQAFTWAYHNDGTGPLTIIAMIPSCGCTVSAAEPKTVPPGGSGALSVSYDPSGQSGDVRKSLTVVTNDPVHAHTILTIRAKVLANEVPTSSTGHPRFTGQSLLMGACAKCHAAPATGKTGASLWSAVCAMCHGETAEGASAPGLRAADYLASHDDASLVQAVAYGTANPRMPGFSNLMGGPLDDAQVASLVALLRTWGPLAGQGPGATPPPKR